MYICVIIQFSFCKSVFLPLEWPTSGYFSYFLQFRSVAFFIAHLSLCSTRLWINRWKFPLNYICGSNVLSPKMSPKHLVAQRCRPSICRLNVLSPKRLSPKWFVAQTSIDHSVNAFSLLYVMLIRYFMAPKKYVYTMVYMHVGVLFFCRALLQSNTLYIPEYITSLASVYRILPTRRSAIYMRFTDISLTNQLADKTTRWQTNSLTLDLPVVLMNSAL